MLKILFFGQLKDIIKTECLEIDIIQSGNALNTVAKLRGMLQAKDDTWKEYLAYGKALVAVNQEMTSDDTAINDADEIAFFPPVTGG
ncbi:molybdopterin converting factor subunit 1 [Paraglaciecola sp. MB-3u-78]|jgi:molybdopterin synthase sulfur carrier subunit|uniref:molybdopterin converting factor subunit 1 n=1 Tax=Paraglaciecola sp. MB-3u-78 TaxID=2058332 RepID=UPI000C328F7C|nr:molybdopterin converting factor subunit 1 [Paraglaciecola sp. MB-3u-78]PKG99690.1 molybdopterin converting factor subunit 1 [Paraglaciecola sp. MB-3u-78]